MDELKEQAAREIKEIKSKIYHCTSDIVKKQLLFDFHNLIARYHQYGMIEEDEYNELSNEFESTQLEKKVANIHSHIAKRSMESNETVLKAVNEVIDTIDTVEYHAEELKRLNINDFKQIMQDFTAWVGKDCNEFFNFIIKNRHVLKTTGAYNGEMVPASTIDNIYVIYDTFDDTYEQLSTLAHEYGHAYSMYLLRNNNFFEHSVSQYIEFFSLFFEKLLDQYCEENHLYIEERRKYRKNDLYNRFDELYVVRHIESLVKNELIEKNIFSYLKPLNLGTDLLDFIQLNYYTDENLKHFVDRFIGEELTDSEKEEVKRQLIEFKNSFYKGRPFPEKSDFKHTKKEKEEIEEFDQELYDLLKKLFSNVDLSKLEEYKETIIVEENGKNVLKTNVVDKETLIDFRIKAIIRAIKLNDFDNLYNVLMSLSPLINTRKNVRKSIEDYSAYYLDDDYLKTVLKNIYKKKIDDTDSPHHELNMSFIDQVMETDNSLLDKLKIIFKDIMEENEIINLVETIININKYASRKTRKDIFTNYGIQFLTCTFTEVEDDTIIDYILDNIFDYVIEHSNTVTDAVQMLFKDLVDTKSLVESYIEANGNNMDNIKDLLMQVSSTLIINDENYTGFIFKNYLDQVYLDNEYNIRGLFMELLHPIVSKVVDELMEKGDITEDEIADYIVDNYYSGIDTLISNYADLLEDSLTAKSEYEENNYHIDNFNSKVRELIHSVLSQVLNIDPTFFENIVDNTFDFNYGEGSKLEKKRALLSYIKTKEKNNENDLTEIVTILSKMLEASDFSEYSDTLVDYFKMFTDDTSLIDEIVLRIGIILEENDKKEDELDKENKFKYVRSKIPPVALNYDYHKYFIGRLFAIYFSDRVKQNKEEGLKEAIEFITTCDKYSYGEILKMYPTIMYHVKEDIVRTFNSERELAKGYIKTK